MYLYTPLTQSNGDETVAPTACLGAVWQRSSRRSASPSHGDEGPPPVETRLITAVRVLQEMGPWVDVGAVVPMLQASRARTLTSGRWSNLVERVERPMSSQNRTNWFHFITSL